MIPEAWIYEHNILHHQHTGESRDPDLIEQNLQEIHRSRLPVLAALWAARSARRDVADVVLRPEDAVAPGSIGTRRKTRRNRPRSACSYDDATRPTRYCHFVALPLLFAPLGTWAVFSAWCNSLMAEMLTNLHTFFVVGPNHTGDDVFRFDDRPASRGEFYVRQVVGSVNYRTAGDSTDYAHLFLNYQIEHHLFPRPCCLSADPARCRRSARATACRTCRRRSTVASPRWRASSSGPPGCAASSSTGRLAHAC